jgi:capsular polysaccharide biosynthesis protein
MGELRHFAKFALENADLTACQAKKYCLELNLSIMNEKKDVYELDALQIVEMLLKRWWIIALAAILCAVLAFGYTSFFVSPTYRADATLLINSGSSLTTTYQEILAGQYQSKDYPYILKAKLTLEEVAAKLNAREYPENGGEPYRVYNAENLSAMISTEAVDESRIFKVIVTSTNPDEARIVANTIVEVFPARVESLIRGGTVGIVDLATTPKHPSSPGYSRNVILGFAIGLILGMAYAIVMGLVNDTIQSEDWLLYSFKEEIPLLSTIPDANAKGTRGYYKYKSRYGYYEHKNS